MGSIYRFAYRARIIGWDSDPRPRYMTPTNQRLSSWRQLQPSRATRCPFLSISHGELNCEEDWKKDISSARCGRISALQTLLGRFHLIENYENTSRASAQSRLARRDCWICEVRRWRHVNGPRWWARCKQSRLTDTLLGHVLSFDTLSRALSASSTARCHAALCALSLQLDQYSTPTLYYTIKYSL